MRITKKVATAFTATGLFAASLIALPFGGTASAKTLTPKMPSDFGSNAAVDVQTDLNCTEHSLTTKITNKTDSKITPNVTFNQVPSSVPVGEINPDTIGYITYNYSGNNMPVNIEVSVDTFDPVKLAPTLHCDEDVSFYVTEASESAVGGMLTNNNTLESQQVITQAVGGAEQVEYLAPGESRFVAMSYNGYPGQTFAFASISVNGRQSRYTIDLLQPLPQPPIGPVQEKPKD
jgi:hypothetical protein